HPGLRPLRPHPRDRPDLPAVQGVGGRAGPSLGPWGRFGAVRQPGPRPPYPSRVASPRAAPVWAALLVYDHGMTDKQLLATLGERVYGWTLLPTGGANLPEPLDALFDALAGRRSPIFWICENPIEETVWAQVAEPGEKAYRWNPLEDSEQRSRLLACIES